MTQLAQPRPEIAANQILPEHLNMVRSIARHIYRRLPQHVEVDDLFSAGLSGLVDAYAKFDPARNASFVGYAKFRVRGAILDSLRDLDWAPRALRYKGRVVQMAIQSLTSRLGHFPADDEVAAELKISLGAYQKLRADLNSLGIESLNTELEGDSGDEVIANIPGRPEDDPLVRCMQTETAERLSKAIGDLPERERLVARLYYFEEMTMREIGLVLGVSEARVQQIRNAAMVGLRTALSDIAESRRKAPVRFRTPSVNTPKPVLLSEYAA